MQYIKKFCDISMRDIGLVGGKNASLGEMISQLSKKGIKIPDGFAVTAEAYWYFINYNNLLEPMKKILERLKNVNDLKVLKSVGAEIRSSIEHGDMPEDLAREIAHAYQELSKEYHKKNVDVAVRSSATAEDLPGASFAGQQDTFLHIQGIDELLLSCKKSMASLFTDRAIIYRIEKGFDHFKVALSIGVQKMIRSDLASAGVIFTLDTETGFKDIVMINSSYGLGEAVVQGIVNPDEFRIHKPTLKLGYKPIIKKKLGGKLLKIIYSTDPERMTKEVPVSYEDSHHFSLKDEEILSLARSALIIEDHYSQRAGSWMPMDIEWAKDGIDDILYIIQARPETVQSQKKHTNILVQYTLKGVSHEQLQHALLVKGESIGQQIASGVARVAKTIDQVKTFKKGDVLVTPMTDPDWVPLMKQAAAIVTDHGGRTSHAAIVSRELGVPAIVGTENATKLIADGQEITVDCSQGTTGFAYKGRYDVQVHEINIQQLPRIPIELMVNIADPDRAIHTSFLPVDGVGLARVEFIISTTIKMHPMAALEPKKVKDVAVRKELDLISCAYPDLVTFFIDTLAQGIGTIAAAFYPRPVIVRLSDFKTNEYRNLIGGSYFEPQEENPMLGLRGASRYYNKLYAPAFALECAALKKARDEMGFMNIKIMIPFVRTVNEAEKVIDIMAQHGLKRHDKMLELYLMCEIPANVILIDDFCLHFDGISIGSNDLTQLTLGIDRDSELLAALFDERDKAVLEMMKLAIKGAKRNNTHSGICGQAPSDYPEIADFLINEGINSISLNIDSVLPFLVHMGKK
jgi:pyruvate, water dikinase